jgi:predicted transcriptional regulator
MDINITAETRARVERLAKENNCKMTEIIEQAVRAYQAPLETEEMMQPKTLKELYGMMQKNDGRLLELYGDWSSLPVFGGSEPPQTVGIWSWDENDLIVGTCSADISIVPREEYF